MHVLKSAILQLFRMGWDGRALLVQPSKSNHGNWKILFVLGFYEYLERDHPFKTSANFSQFLTLTINTKNTPFLILPSSLWDHPFQTSPYPLPSSVFYYYTILLYLANFWPLPPKQWWRLKWMVPKTGRQNKRWCIFCVNKSDDYSVG